jgi:protein-arginine kinase activator protein McsA
LKEKPAKKLKAAKPKTELNLRYVAEKSPKIRTREDFCCPRCDKTFLQVKHYQIFCSDACENYFDNLTLCIADQFYNSKCIQCNGDVRRTAGQHRLCEACRRTNRKKYEIEYYEKKKADSLINPKVRKKGPPLSELNRRAEYKRVFDDAGWRHYLKGRMWDKI